MPSENFLAIVKGHLNLHNMERLESHFWFFVFIFQNLVKKSPSHAQALYETIFLENSCLCPALAKLLLLLLAFECQTFYTTKENTNAEVYFILYFPTKNCVWVIVF